MFGMSQENKDALRAVILATAAVLLLVGGATFIIRCNYAVDNAFINYEAFQDLHTSCVGIAEKICNLNKIPETDPAFKDLSKAAQRQGLKSLLLSRVNEYNSKSAQWNRSMWKSSELPYRLDANSFRCYNDQ